MAESQRCSDIPEAKPRRVVRLSRVDRERLERGDITYPEEAVHLSDARNRAPSEYSKGRKAPHNVTLTPLERDMIDNLPPHFGKL